MAKKKSKYAFGWLPDLPDQRDDSYFKSFRTQDLPETVNLRESLPAVYDQGQLGSCTAQAIAGAIEFCQFTQDQSDRFTPSRLYIYWYERLLIGTVVADSGARIRDGMKVINRLGAPHETIWPYNISRFRTPPSIPAVRDGRKHQAIDYQRIDSGDLNAVKDCLASTGPVIIGVTCYDSFVSNATAKTGDIPLPSSNEAVAGGHAILLSGYDDKRKLFNFRNSWGEGWGDNGYGTIPYYYISDENLADDAWSLRVVE